MLPASSAFEVTTLWRYTNLFIIIIIFLMAFRGISGVVTLRQDYRICEKDKQLTPEQAQILVGVSCYVA